MTRSTRSLAVITLACLMSLAAASGAGAATLFAAPGATTVIAGCIDPARPCSIASAASNAQFADEVVLAPGEYSDAGGDLGQSGRVLLKQGVSLRGASGEPRPVITLSGSAVFGAFLVGVDSTVSRVEIDSATAQTNITVDGGSIEDVVAKSTASGGFHVACNHTDGSIRNSVCLSSGTGAIAVGTAIGIGGATPHALELRHVTAVATGAGSSGISYSISGTLLFTVEADGVIASGVNHDVVADARNGARVDITLDHSAYDESTATTDGKTGSSSAATAAGLPPNITALPQLAADGYHQLPTSPTIDAGPLDDPDGMLDIDGDQRAIGSASDIGADEVKHATTLTVACTPTTPSVGANVTCTATVDDAAAAGRSAPGGLIQFVSDGNGTFSGGGACTLIQPAQETAASCEVTYTPAREDRGERTITASYAGDFAHEGSERSVKVAVLEPSVPGPVDPGAGPGPGPGDSGSTPPPPRTPEAPVTSLRRTPRRTTVERRARFAFAADQAGSTFQCAFDGARFKRCSAQVRRIVKPGRHRLRVRAVNAQGVADPTPAIFRWTVRSRRR